MSKEHPFINKKQFSFLGLGKQDAIKFLFGGNALISIIALILITLFLAKESIYFFPDYQSNLNIYRKSGKEFADYAENQLKYQKEIKSLVTQVKQYELFHQAGVDAYIPELFSTMKTVAIEKMTSELLAVKIAKNRITSKEIIWDIWSEGSPEEQAQMKAQKAEFSQNLIKTQEALTAKINKIAPSIKISTLSPQFQKKAYEVQRQEPSAIKTLQEALISYFSNYTVSTKTPDFITQSSRSGVEKRTVLLQTPLFSNLSQVEKELTETYLPFNAFVEKLRDHALLVSIRAESFLSAADRKKAIEEGIPEASPEKKKKLLIDLKRLITEDQDYGQQAEVLYATLPEHQELLSKMTSSSHAIFPKLPNINEFENKGARRIHKKLTKLLKDYDAFMAQQRSNMESWRHDQTIGFLKTLGGFVFGQKWISNSSWHNFFGLAPLFGGSLFITLIAITIATPFAVGGAIYVNRIASKAEQNFIKPIIEFIQAIPSVVLAFLGVVVVGQNILKLSYIPWLEWLPGFPASGEQMMLTAGVLLAFMAIPTMFTLAEDAINNVPKSYTEASLSLGATRLQTIFNVIIPSSLSGVVAAILLGFGRIIGETMVVLLVAGGTIDWPTTWTDPVHTMTGIIAQSTGEAAPGSIQYRALFLVGLFLFGISLIINSLAQNVIKKFGSKH